MDGGIFPDFDGSMADGFFFVVVVSSGLGVRNCLDTGRSAGGMGGECPPAFAGHRSGIGNPFATGTHQRLDFWDQVASGISYMGSDRVDWRFGLGLGMEKNRLPNRRGRQQIQIQYRL